MDIKHLHRRLTLDNNKKPLINSVIVGFTAGFVEISVNHPLWVIKARMQIGLGMPHKISAFYNGIFGNIVTMVPMTAFRIICSTTIHEHLTPNESKSKESNLMLSGLLGGFLPSIISSPIEYTRSYQIKNNISLSASSIELYKTHGAKYLSHGLISTGLRDSIYTIGFFSLTPLLDEKIKVTVSGSNLSTVGAGIISGTISAFLSHPFDTIKSEQQFKHLGKKSVAQVASDIYKRNGLHGFFKGGMPRITRVISATAIIPTTMNAINSYLKK